MLASLAEFIAIYWLLTRGADFYGVTLYASWTGVRPCSDDVLIMDCRAAISRSTRRPAVVGHRRTTIGRNSLTPPTPLVSLWRLRCPRTTRDRLCTTS